MNKYYGNPTTDSASSRLNGLVCEPPQPNRPILDTLFQTNEILTNNIESRLEDILSALTGESKGDETAAKSAYSDMNVRQQANDAHNTVMRISHLLDYICQRTIY